MSEFVLIQKIIELSEADNWEEAKKEWIHSSVYISEQPKTCLCNHHPIKNICVIDNTKNKQQTIVGNCCIKKFFDERIGRVFTSIKESRINADLINYAYETGIIDDWEQGFMLDLWRKKNLTKPQTKYFQKIRGRILEASKR